MNPRWLRAAIVILAAVLLHLPAHFAPWSGTPLRQPLPEDGPAFVRNQSLAAREGEGVAAAAVRAAHDRAAAWEGAAETVGAARWRPVATALLAAERAAPWAGDAEGAVRGAAIVSLLLHVLVALGAAALAASLGGGARAALVAGLLAAASPAALSSAAWPARQPVVLAAALAVGGTLLALRGGAARLAASGFVLALAGLAHEAAFGWVLAVAPLRAAANGGRPRWLSAWPCAVLPAAAFAARCHFLGGLGGTSPVDGAARDAPNAVDGLTGVVRAFAAFAVPSRLHFADGPYAFPFLAHLAAVAALAAGGALLVRHRGNAAAAAALGAALALLVVPAALAVGAGIAPFQDGNLYLVLPLLAASAGILFAGIAARSGPVRLAGVTAAALLVGASVAATAARAPSFRTKATLIALAQRDMPESLVVRAWSVADAAGGGPKSMAAAAPQVLDLARSAGGVAARRLRGDAVAAATISRFLTEYASAIRASSVPLTDSAYDAADAAGAAACDLVPRSSRAWWELASLRLKTGALRGAYDTATHAAALAPDDIAIAQLSAEIGLAVGDGRFAADTMERAHEALRADEAHAAISPEFLLLYARALAADGALRVPDPASVRGLRYRYDLAAEVLLAVRELETERAPTSSANRLLYDVYLRYGDLLATADRPAMALIAYGRAVDLTGGSEKSLAAEHLRWLMARLGAEETAAKAQIDAADKEPGRPNIANALVELYVSFCRQGKWTDADAAFAQIEEGLHGIPPELRMRRAVERYAALEDDENQARAETELRQVVAEKPSLARARYELARVLEWQGTLPRFGEARALHEQAAREGALEDWSLDAIDRARAIEELLLRSSP